MMSRTVTLQSTLGFGDVGPEHQISAQWMNVDGGWCMKLNNPHRFFVAVQSMIRKKKIGRGVHLWNVALPSSSRSLSLSSLSPTLSSPPLSPYTFVILFYPFSIFCSANLQKRLAPDYLLAYRRFQR